MNKDERLKILVSQLDIMKAIVEENPSYKGIAGQQFEGVIKYSRSLGDIDHEEEKNIRLKYANFVKHQFA